MGSVEGWGETNLEMQVRAGKATCLRETEDPLSLMGSTQISWIGLVFPRQEEKRQ